MSTKQGTHSLAFGIWEPAAKVPDQDPVTQEADSRRALIQKAVVPSSNQAGHGVTQGIGGYVAPAGGFMQAGASRLDVVAHTPMEDAKSDQAATGDKVIVVHPFPSRQFV